LLLGKVNFNDQTVHFNGVTYRLRDSLFPTVDPNNPYQLTEEEQKVIDHLQQSYLNNDLLQDHIRLMFDKGSMYLCFNESLLFHAAVPWRRTGLG
jgi:fructose-1,6-bisphosphatase III